MKNTIILTDEQMKALQSGQSITIEPPKPNITKWEPKGGNYLVHRTFDGAYEDLAITMQEILSGKRYQTKEQAKQAAKALRSYARQLAWLAENEDGYIFDSKKDEFNYYIYYSEAFCKYEKEYHHKWKMLNTIYMSKQNAEKLCKLLNSGIVEF